MPVISAFKAGRKKQFFSIYRFFAFCSVLINFKVQKSFVKMPTAKNITTAIRNSLLHFLLERLEGDTLQRGAIAEAGRHFGFSHQAVSKLWKKWVAVRAASLTDAWDVTSDKTKNGPSPKYDRDAPRIALVQLQNTQATLDFVDVATRSLGTRRPS